MIDEDELGCEYCLLGGELDEGICPVCGVEVYDYIEDDDGL